MLEKAYVLHVVCSQLGKAGQGSRGMCSTGWAIQNSQVPHKPHQQSKPESVRLGATTGSGYRL